MTAFFRKIHTIRNMGVANIGVFVEASMLLFAGYIMIKLFPFSWWKRQVMVSARAPEAKQEPTREQKKIALMVMRSIAQVNRNAGGLFVCLPQALAARWMLSRRGVATDLYLGTMKSVQDNREFHAWLKVGDLMVTGACKEEDYAIFGSQYRV